MTKNKKNSEVNNPVEEILDETAAPEELCLSEDEVKKLYENTKYYQDALDTVAELAAEKDKFLRMAAEYDNYRKRSQKEREQLYIEVQAETISKLLPVYDNLERGLEQKSTDETLYKGVELTLAGLKDAFARMGVQVICPIGETFNPTRHSAIMHVEDDKLGEGVVCECFQKGFILGDKVIRFAVVKVAN